MLNVHIQSESLPSLTELRLFLHRVLCQYAACSCVCTAPSQDRFLCIYGQIKWEGGDEWEIEEWCGKRERR